MKYKLRNLSEYQFIGNVQKVEVDGKIINITCKIVKVQIHVLNDRMFRVRITNNEFKEDYSYAVVDVDWPDVDLTVNDEGNQIVIITSMLQIQIKKTPFSLSVQDGEGNPINQDAGLGGYAWHDDEVICFKKMPAGEHYYGFGEKSGDLDKRGCDFVNWNVDAMMYNHKTDPLYVSVPFFIALNQGKAYGIFLDNTYKSFFNMGKNVENVYYFGAVDGELNYYFIHEPDMKEVINQYTQLTGRPYFPPKWSLGYQQCRWSYKTEKEVRQVAGELRKRKIPCDIIVLDIDFMDGYRVFTWNKKRFPDPKRLISDMRDLGFKIYVIVDPGIKVDEKYKFYNDIMEKELYCKREDGTPFYGWVWPGKCVFPDFTREDVRVWWGNNLTVYLNEGISGIWNDMNEPSIESGNVINAAFRKVSTKDLIHYDNGLNSPHAKIHNVYGLCMSWATREGLLRLQPEKRPFMISRSGFAGIQRYAAIWTGDNTSSWLHLKLSVTMLLNMGLSGIHFCGADIGGFAASLMHPRKLIFKLDPELYARWIQLGVFYPFSRTHTMAGTRRQEPWQFGENVEEISRRYIQLRYNLMPYIYTLFHEANQRGLPIMRPLVLEHQDDEKCLNLDDEFYFGSQLLVIPIIKKRIKKQKIYLPKGKWINYWTKEEFQGPKDIELNITLENIPIFIKGGSIIPTQPEMQYIGDKPLNLLILDVYPYKISEYTLYEDDGDSMNYLNGEFCNTIFRCIEDDKKIKFVIGQRKGDFEPEKRDYEVRINGLKKIPEKISFNGKSIALKNEKLEDLDGIFCEFIENKNNNFLCLRFPDESKKVQIEVIL